MKELLSHLINFTQIVYYISSIFWNGNLMDRALQQQRPLLCLICIFSYIGSIVVVTMMLMLLSMGRDLHSTNKDFYSKSLNPDSCTFKHYMFLLMRAVRQLTLFIIILFILEVIPCLF